MTTRNVASLSHPGRRRRKNEDAVLVKDCGGGLLLVVADGVGGERGGEVASQEAVRIISHSLDWQPHLPAAAGSLAAAITRANEAILARGAKERRLRGMATTIVAALVRGAEVWVANVGDSRAYTIDERQISQITQDHSLVAERLVEGSITEEEAKVSRARHVITRSVGTLPEVEVDLFGPLLLSSGQTLLLCSDGLTDAVDDDVIQDIVCKADVRGASEGLVHAANGNGGPDNVSVILYRPLAD